MGPQIRTIYGKVFGPIARDLMKASQVRCKGWLSMRHGIQ